MSVAGGMWRAVEGAVGLGMGTVQVFTQAPAQWGVKRTDDGWQGKILQADVVERWKAACGGAGFGVTVVHDSYLINLASGDADLWGKSVAAFEHEFKRCGQLGVTYLVTHPGSHLGTGEEAGLGRVVEGLVGVFGRAPDEKTVVCLEVTAGQGTSLGYRLEHLRDVIRGVEVVNKKWGRRLGVCLDSAHLLAGGYDFRGRKYAGFKSELEKTVGVDRVKVWHVNDSKKDLGSRVDRHEHIGLGFVGLDGFKPIVRDKDWATVPKILETAKAKHDSGRDWDAINLEVLRSMEK